MSVYFNEAELQTLAADAEKTGFRRVGIPIKRQKPNGFSGEWLANTDGISRHLKFCASYYVLHEAERKEQEAEALRARREADERLNALRAPALLGKKEKPAQGGGSG